MTKIYVILDIVTLW